MSFEGSPFRKDRKLRAPSAAECLRRSPSIPAKMCLHGDGDTVPSRLLMEQVPISVLKPDPRNARTHSKKQVRQIAASIREFGFVNPVLIDEANLVIAGHGRLAAARLLSLVSVPAIRLAHLSETQKRALVIVDNKLAENAAWDEELLAQELQSLSEVEVDFDIEITGFEAAEIDLLIEGLAPVDDPSADEIPACGQEIRPRSRGELGKVRKHHNEASGAGGLRIYSDPSRVGPIRDQ